MTVTRQSHVPRAAIIDQMVDALIVGDDLCRVIECNGAAARLFDVRAEDLIGVTMLTTPWRMFDMHGIELPQGTGPLARATRGETVAGEYRIVTQTELERWVSVSAFPLRTPDGALSGAVLVLRDVAEFRAAQVALRDSEERYRRLVEMCPDPIIVHSDGVIVYANPATLDLGGADRADQIVGHSMFEFVDPALKPWLESRTRRALETGESNGMAQIAIKRLNGELIEIELASTPIMFEGKPAVQGVMRDVTQRKQAEAALAYQALHDALTGLPNRVLLMDRLEQAIATAQREGASVGLLLMDLDHFKEVNDTLGHYSGDLLLQQVATRVRGALRQVDTIARLGGDEFAIVLPGTDILGVGSVVANLLRRLRTPFSVEGQPVMVGASVGVALSPLHGVEATTLLRRADVAMYAAKHGGNGFSIYQAEYDRNSAQRLTLIGELRRAIDEGELILHYQPKMDLVTGQLAGVEALVRWEHPMRGVLAPDQFIPEAEHAGLIEPLSGWVLRAALVQAMAWNRNGMRVRTAVNLSMRSFHDEQLPEKISALLAAVRAPASLLSLEITESTLMLDLPRTLDILERLRAMGFHVSIDDFGTGHSSLAYLKRLPVDEIKIDRSFVKDIVSDATDRIIVRATIDLAHSLGLRVVAEGVEDAPTCALLTEFGCDEAQGFYFSPPMRGHDLTQWLGGQSIAA